MASNKSKAMAIASQAVITTDKLTDAELAIIANNPKNAYKGKMQIILDNREGLEENGSKPFLIGGAMHQLVEAQKKGIRYHQPTKVKCAGSSMGFDLMTAGAIFLVKGFTYAVDSEAQFDEDFQFLNCDPFGTTSSRDMSSAIGDGKTGFHTKDNILKVKQFEFSLTPLKGMAIWVLPKQKVSLILDVTIIEK